MLFFIADTHFGHKNAIWYDHRPFQSVKEMDEELIKRWNSRVTNGDTVYILGDFSWHNTDRTMCILKRLKGKKRLIKGNHDRVKPPELRKEFDYIKEYEQISVGRKVLILCYYSIPFYNRHHHDAVMIHGHTHNSKEHLLELEIERCINESGIPCNMYNVGCMLPYMDYMPRTLDEIIKRKENYGFERN